MPIPDYIRKMRALVGHELIVVVGTSAVICNERGEVLLQHRSDNGLWGIPAGCSIRAKTLRWGSSAKCGKKQV